ncbi:MAG: DUF1570 domain-containing protein [Gemmataceae bacterium]
MPWPTDEVVLKNGAAFRGLVLADTPAGLEFKVVRRQPGRPTVTLTTLFLKAEVDHVRRLPAADREVLREKLAELDEAGSTERLRMDTLTVTSTDWLGKPGAARRYASDQFVLVSAAPEEVTRRAAVRLEQLYAAFARVFPPRRPAERPTVVMLAGTPAEYAALVGPSAGRVVNPAVYLVAENRVVCGSDLTRLGAEVEAARQAHTDRLAQIDRYEAEVRRLYKGQPNEIDRFVRKAADQRRRVRDADRANDRRFDAATDRLFAMLYHEAFHAYIGVFVYPPLPPAAVRAGRGVGELPRWLNEGLAQIFETAVVEAGELRVGHADPARLAKVRDRLAGKGEPLAPVADLLRAGRERFAPGYAGGVATAEQAYLTAWGVAMYLTFDRHRVGAAGFDDYLAAVNAGTDPVTAFEEWVGQPVSEFEKGFHDYLRRLRPDGTVGHAK